MEQSGVIRWIKSNLWNFNQTLHFSARANPDVEQVAKMLDNISLLNAGWVQVSDITWIEWHYRGESSPPSRLVIGSMVSGVGWHGGSAKEQVLLITEKSFDIRTFFRISDPDTDDDGAENQGKTNGTSNSTPSINVSGMSHCLSEFFDRILHNYFQQ